MGRAKLLIVEDEPIEALHLKNILTELGYDVVGSVMSGEECISLIPSDPPDLVIMDIKLRGAMDGIEAAAELGRNYGMPVVFATALSDKTSLSRAKEAEPYGYIIKPYDDKNIYTTIEMSLFKHRTDRRLRESELKYRTLFEKSRDSIFMADAAGVITDANGSMANLTGYDRSDIIGMNIADLVSGGEWSTICGKVREGEYADSREIFLKRNDGSESECLLSCAHIIGADGLDFGCQGIIRDITEHKRLERIRDKLYKDLTGRVEELRESREELRNLSAHLQSLREAERMQIAREIHDVLGPSLTALKMDLFWTRSRVPRGLDGLFEKIEGMLLLVDSIIDNVRRISSELRPGVLDDLGLRAAIEWYADEFEKRNGIPCRITCDTDDLIIDEMKSITLYRIFQESLTNVIRHARATEVSVILENKGGSLTLTVKDNGTGITEAQINDPTSFGIIGIRERVLSCGGTVFIEGRRGGGTTVRAAVPLREGCC
jgi:PAS domain S-box-containing protein